MTKIVPSHVVVDFYVHGAHARALLHLQLILGPAGAHEVVQRRVERRVPARRRVRVPLVGADRGRVRGVRARLVAVVGPVAHVHLVRAVRYGVVLMPQMVSVTVVVPGVVHLKPRLHSLSDTLYRRRLIAYRLRLIKFERFTILFISNKLVHRIFIDQ